MSDYPPLKKATPRSIPWEDYAVERARAHMELGAGATGTDIYVRLGIKERTGRRYDRQLRTGNPRLR